MSSVARSVSDFRSDVFGINDQAKFAQGAAMAEQAARQAMTAEARAGRERINLAAQSPQELAALEKSLGAAQTQVDTELRQLAAIDPAIMEASKQVLGLLKGETAASNNPMMAQRTSQRQQLVNSLRAQYGPGAESTSIGQRALQQFDMESNSMFAQNQQNSLGNLFGIATTRVNGAGVGNLLNTAQGFGGMQSRLLGAEQFGSQNILAALGGEVQSAGAQFTGDMLRAGAQRQFFQQMEDDGRQIGRSWATMGMSNKGGGGGGNGGGMLGGLGGDMPAAQGGAAPIGNGGGFGMRNV